MRKILLLLAMVAMLAAVGSTPRVEAANDCYWYCDCEGVHCSCGNPRSCPWPPPPIACPICDF